MLSRMTDRIRGLPQTKEHGARSVSDVSLEVLGPAYFNTAAALMGYQLNKQLGFGWTYHIWTFIYPHFFPPPDATLYRHLVISLRNLFQT